MAHCSFKKEFGKYIFQHLNLLSICLQISIDNCHNHTTYFYNQFLSESIQENIDEFYDGK